MEYNDKHPLSSIDTFQSDELIAFINAHLSPCQSLVTTAEIICRGMGDVIAWFSYSFCYDLADLKDEAGIKLDQLMVDLSGEPSFFSKDIWGVGCGLLYLVGNGMIEGEEDELLEEIDSFLHSHITAFPYSPNLYWFGALSYLSRRISGDQTKKDLRTLLINKHYLILLLDCLEQVYKENVEMDLDIKNALQDLHQAGFFPVKTSSLLDKLTFGKKNNIHENPSFAALPDERCTIVIPVRIDSKERERNLNFILDYLTQLADTNIIVLEADKTQRYFLKHSYSSVCYLFMEDRDPVFHRTKYLNKLLKKARTGIVGVWDTDVIISLEQIEEAIRVIRSGTADLVYPFDGRFYMLEKEQTEHFMTTKDAEFLSIHHHEFLLPHGFSSVGGAFLVNRELYMKYGGENEFFYGWGPEDVERQKRMEILGIPVARVEGPLYHLYHPRLENSLFSTKEQEIRNRSELIKICSMSREELTEYISSWDWIVPSF